VLVKARCLAAAVFWAALAVEAMTMLETIATKKANRIMMRLLPLPAIV
jgi:hypothetical protein